MDKLNALAKKLKDVYHQQLVELVGSLQDKISLLSHELYGKRFHEPYGMKPLFDKTEVES